MDINGNSEQERKVKNCECASYSPTRTLWAYTSLCGFPGGVEPDTARVLVHGAGGVWRARSRLAGAGALLEALNEERPWTGAPAETFCAFVRRLSLLCGFKSKAKEKKRRRKEENERNLEKIDGLEAQ